MKKRIMLAAMAILLLLAGCGKKKEDIDMETNVLWTGYSDSAALYTNCLNTGLLVISSVRHLPVFLIESSAQLEEFMKKYGESFGEYYGQDDTQAFRNAVKDYDEGFFKEKSLVLAYITAGSGSFRYGVKSVEVTDTSVCVYVEQTNNPEVYTMDMAGWMAVAELDKDACGSGKRMMRSLRRSEADDNIDNRSLSCGKDRAGR